MASVVVGLGAAVAGVGLALGVCLLAGVPSSVVGVVGCLLLVVPVGVRPAWALGRLVSSG